MISEHYLEDWRSKSELRRLEDWVSEKANSEDQESSVSENEINRVESHPKDSRSNISKKVVSILSINNNFEICFLRQRLKIHSCRNFPTKLHTIEHTDQTKRISRIGERRNCKKFQTLIN